MDDEFFFDYSDTIMAYDDFEYIERKEKIGVMIDLIVFQDDSDDKILELLCDLLDENADDFLEAHHVSREGNVFTVDEEYIKDTVYKNR